MKRRRAIKVMGSAALCGLAACRRPDAPRTFSAIAFGTEVGFQTHGISQFDFDEISGKCFQRLREIESLFSLYEPESAISRLNRNGKLRKPPEEFLELVRSSLGYGEKTGGIFDISVQPLWEWRRKWKQADLTGRSVMERNTWDNTLSLVGFRNVIANEEEVTFTKPGMAITLNGIVQGYATDRIAALLRENGVRNVLVNIGEYAAIGGAADGKPWKVKLAANGEPEAIPSGRALAVSSGSGYTFEPEGRLHHIFRPSDGANPRPESTILVTAPTASEADALSTTFTVASDAERRGILAKFPKADFREIR